MALLHLDFAEDGHIPGNGHVRSRVLRIDCAVVKINDVRGDSVAEHEMVIVLMLGPKRIAGINDGVPEGAGIQQGQLIRPLCACRIADNV